MTFLCHHVILIIQGVESVLMKESCNTKMLVKTDRVKLQTVFKKSSDKIVTRFVVADRHTELYYGIGEIE